MGFRNSILAGEELVRSAIRSPNYDPGVAGWRVSRNGDAEFNDVTVRGRLEAKSNVPGDDSSILIEFANLYWYNRFGTLAFAESVDTSGGIESLTETYQQSGGRGPILDRYYDANTDKTGIHLTAEELFLAGDQDQLAAWNTWVVGINTMSGYGTSTRTGRWRRIGTTVHLQLVFTWAGAFTFGNANPMRVTLPVAATSAMQQLLVLRHNTSGAAGVGIGLGFINPSVIATEAELRTAANATIPGTGIVAGDNIRLHGTYEAAAA